MDRQQIKHGALFIVLLVVLAVLPARVASAAAPIPGLQLVSAGGEHTCARVAATGQIKCWGLNDRGQLGDGTTTMRTVPPATFGIPGFASVVAGGSHTCGIAASGGGVWCWGNNTRAQVGTTGTSERVITPFRITSVDVNAGVSQIALGAEHTCALKDGGVKCWGRSDAYQIGNNSTQTAFQPLQVTGLLAGSGVKALAAGGKHNCVITATNTVKCWGLNENGQIGNNSTAVAPTPVDVPGLANVQALALGGQHSCALITGGSVQCWGDNSAGSIGDNTTTNRLTPVAAQVPVAVSAIAAGGRETCAISTAGALYCWGLNSSGQVGDGTTGTPRKVPVAVPGATANVAAVSVGRAHACLRTAAGLTKCWGENQNGQLGDGARPLDLYGPFLPDPPRNVVATRGNQSATVQWTAPSSDGGFPIVSYTVTASPGGSEQVISPGVLTASFTGLTNGTPYIFAVKATNSVGASRTSSSAPVTPATFPGAPTSVSATAGTATGSAVISWNAAPTNGSAISSYTAVASPGGRSAKVGGTSRKATISGLTPGATYSFKVTARNGVGAGPASSSASVKLPKSKVGYLMLGAGGTVYPFGNAPRLGGAVYTNWSSGTRAAAITVRANGSGYWTVDTAGGVRAFGTARYLGQRPPLRPGESVSTLAGTPTGKGYWLFTNQGRAIRYGDAKFYGDMSRVRLNGPVIASAATPTGKGYYMVASDGGVFTFGDAKFYGSTGAKRLNKPVVGLSATPTNRGYWLVASDGGVFTFGDATFRGSMGSVRLAKPVNGLVPFGKGYLMVASDGGVFVFSNKAFLGSLGARPPSAPIIGIAAFAT